MLGEIGGVFQGLGRMVEGVIIGDGKKITSGRNQVVREVAYTEATIHFHTFVHFPSISEFSINDLILDDYEVHHGIAAKLADAFTNTVKNGILESIHNIDRKGVEEEIRQHINIQRFRRVVIDKIFKHFGNSLDYNVLDNCMKVIFHEAALRGRINFPASGNGSITFKMEALEIEIPDDFQMVSEVFYNLSERKSSRITEDSFGVVNARVLNSDQFESLEFKITVSLYKAFGVMVFDVCLEVSGTWLPACIEMFEFVCLQELRSRQDVINGNVKIDLKPDRNFARVGVALRVGMDSQIGM